MKIADAVAERATRNLFASLILQKEQRASRAMEAFIDFYLAQIALDKELRQENRPRTSES